MGYPSYKDNSSQAILEAIETLSSIAELNIDSPIELIEEQTEHLQDFPVLYQTIHWLHERNADKVMGVVKNTFKTILHYLRSYYKNEYGQLIQHESVEDIKTIMVLVGEAAKKLDKYTKIFVGTNVCSIKNLKEYQDLWGFYKKKIAPIAVQESLTRWIKLLPLKVVLEGTKERETLRIPTISSDYMLDEELLKKDIDYELLCIRKADSSRYYHQRLLRNIKLLCNFEEYYGGAQTEDALFELKQWEERLLKNFVINILTNCAQHIDGFLHIAPRIQGNSLVKEIYSALVALMLVAHHSSGQHNAGHKGVVGYFNDFLHFMRIIVTHSDYQKMIAYDTGKIDDVSHMILTLIQELLYHCHEDFHFTQDSFRFIDEIITIGKLDLQEHDKYLPSLEPTLSQKLGYEYEAICRGALRFENAPLLKDISMLQDIMLLGYDPWMMKNLPSRVFDIFLIGKHAKLLRLPAPLWQENILKAHITEEFKNFLRAKNEENQSKTHLLFYFEDGLHWKNTARSKALHELAGIEEFKDVLSVVHIPRDGDFYHQAGIYADMNQAQDFIEILLDHVLSEKSGYWYPEHLLKKVQPLFFTNLAHAIHKVFFSGRNVLSKMNRLDFIELYHLLLEVKIVEAIQPETVSMSCKDGLDNSLPCCIEFFMIFKLFNERSVSMYENEYLKMLLWGLPFVLRGRNIFCDRFLRMNAMLRLLESTIDEIGAKELMKLVQEKIMPLFESDILTALVSIPKEMHL